MFRRVLLMICSAQRQVYLPCIRRLLPLYMVRHCERWQTEAGVDDMPTGIVFCLLWLAFILVAMTLATRERS